MKKSWLKNLQWMLCLLWMATGIHAQESGEDLFLKHCAICHGDDGDGGVGVPLNLPAFLDSVDDDYLRQTIRRGRPGRVMPGFTSLANIEVDAIVSHLRSWSDQKAPQFFSSPIRGDIEKGQKLFKENCAVCHGDKGQGGHGTGVTLSRQRELPILAPALNNAGFLASAKDELIHYTISKGREGTPMIGFAEAGLEPQEINDLVAFIRSYASAHESHHPARFPPTLSVVSDENFDDTVESVRDAIIGRNFSLIREQTLEHGYFPESEQNTRQVMLYFCNFNFLFKAMNIDPRVGLFLPCRVTVAEVNGEVRIMVANPMALSQLFNNDELNEACETMRSLYLDMIEEAAL